jgi:hypothetical protein
LPDPNKIKNEDDLRGELTKQLANFTELDRRFRGIQSAFKAPNGANDYAMIVDIAKILDPISVVREGEVEAVKKTAGLPDQLFQAFLKVQGGGILSPQVRAQIFGLADTRYRQEAERATQAGERMVEIAKSRGLNVDNVLPSILKQPAQGQPPARPAARGARATDDDPLGILGGKK